MPLTNPYSIGLQMQSLSEQLMSMADDLVKERNQAYAERDRYLQEAEDARREKTEAWREAHVQDRIAVYRDRTHKVEDLLDDLIAALDFASEQAAELPVSPEVSTAFEWEDVLKTLDRAKAHQKTRRLTTTADSGTV